MGLVYTGSFVILVAVIIFTGAALNEWRKRRKEKKEDQEKADREKMLRILPQLGIGFFKNVVLELGWVKKCGLFDSDGAVLYWTINLPKASFGHIELIGAAFGSIVKNWEAITGNPLVDTTNLAMELAGAYSKDDQAKFIAGMKGNNPSAGDEAELFLKEVNRKKLVQQDEERLEEIVNAGLLASVKFINK
ncbi:MAG: hypothetical protein WCW56_00840 [Candidatus Paceibacterota bacterium]